jgi:hypothetical protein
MAESKESRLISRGVQYASFEHEMLRYIKRLENKDLSMVSSDLWDLYDEAQCHQK